MGRQLFVDLPRVRSLEVRETDFNSHFQICHHLLFFLLYSAPYNPQIKMIQRLIDAQRISHWNAVDSTKSCDPLDFLPPG